ncbi:MAG: TRAP transporter substrate-binding protein DctP [Deltaproteobacteria bacterium]|nr:TRAP transporter substrate-binding protein DctP [Deltaproteobacteria bacterium]
MIHRRIGFAPIVLLLVAAFALPGTTTSTKAEESYTLRIASLAPTGSSWMKVLNAWNTTLKKKTDGKLQARFYPGGSQGDERDFIRKMRVGQLDGAVVTMTGMSMVVRSMIVLVLPGFLDTYEELDRVRAKMAPQFEAMFDKEGFKLVGWGDAGKNRLFSAKPFRAPADLKSLRPWVWKDELVFVELYDVIGANAVRLGVPEVYPALQTRMIDTISASALTAIALQWHTRVKYMTGWNSAIIAGGTLMRKDKFDELPPDFQEIFESTAARAHELLNRSVRKDDEKAYQVILKKGIQVVEAGDAKPEWDAAYKKVRDNFTGRLFPKSLVTAVAEAAAP